MRFDTDDYSSFAIETELQGADDPEALARRDAELEAQRRAAAEAQAAADALAAAEANAEAQFEAARAAASEAETANAALTVLPTDDELGGEAVLVSCEHDTYTEPGQYTQELEVRLADFAIPKELELPVDNLRAATAQADELFAQGYVAQGAAMHEALQDASEPIFVALAEAQVARASPLEQAPVVAQASPVAQAPVVTASPLDPPPLAPPNDYFTGSFESPPPGGWFWGIGDAGRTGQEGGVYQWLSDVVATRAEASEHGAYLLAGSDQVTSVGQHLSDVAVYPVLFESQIWIGEGYGNQSETRMMSRSDAITELRSRGNDDNAIAAYLAEHEQYLIRPSYNTGGDGGSDVPAVWGTQADYLGAIGLGPNAPMDLQIAFNTSASGGGDAWVDTSHATQNSATWGPERAYVAIVDDKLAGEWTQIGDIGPINDDVNEMLGEVYARYGATSPEQQEAIRNVLFKYDERFGVLANRELVAAAVEKNNARRQGFFEGPLGRTLLVVAASFIPYAGPYVALMLNAAFQLSDGASFGRVVAGAAVSYFTQQYTAEFGNYVAGAFGESISPAVAEVIAAGARNLGNAAINQLMSGNGLDGEGLLLAAAAGGFGSYITNFVDGSDFGRALDEQFGRFRAGDIIGRLAASAVDGKLSASDFAGAFAAGRADQVTTVQGTDGTHVFAATSDGMLTFNPDGSITQLTVVASGQVVATTYGPDGQRVVEADAFTGAPASTTRIVGTPLDDDGNLNPDFLAFTRYEYLDLPPSSAEVYEAWRIQAESRGSLVSADIPADVAAAAQASTLRVGVSFDGNPYFGSSGALARVEIDGQERIVMFTVMHGIGGGAYNSVLQSPQGTQELGEGGFGLVAQTTDGRVTSIPLDDVITNFVYNDQGKPVFVRNTTDIMNANLTDGMAVILPPETAALLVRPEDLAKLPSLSQQTLGAGAAAYQFGFPGFTEALGGLSSSADLRLLTGSTREVTRDQSNQLIATGVASATNPPQSTGSSGGPLFARDASGNVVLVGVTSLVQGTNDPNTFNWAYTPIRGLRNGFYFPPRRP